jgi:hypothetical protein
MTPELSDPGPVGFEGAPVVRQATNPSISSRAPTTRDQSCQPTGWKDRGRAAAEAAAEAAATKVAAATKAAKAAKAAASTAADKAAEAAAATAAAKAAAANAATAAHAVVAPDRRSSTATSSGGAAAAATASAAAARASHALGVTPPPRFTAGEREGGVEGSMVNDPTADALKPPYFLQAKHHSVVRATASAKQQQCRQFG